MAVDIFTDNQLFKSLATNVHSSVMALDAVGTVLFINDHLSIHAGIKKELFIGENIEKLASEDDQLSDFASFLKEQLEKKKNGSGTFLFKTRNQLDVNINMNFVYLGDNGPNKIAGYCISNDVSSPKLFMNFLFAEHIRNQEYMNDMPLLICRYTPNGTITFYNKFFYSIFGNEKRSPRNLADDFDFRDTNDHLKRLIFPKLKSRLKSFRFTLTINGKRRWFLGTVHEFEDNPSNCQHQELQLVALDVTAQTVAELEIINSQHQFHLIIDAIDDIIATFDSNLCILLTNKHAQRIAERYNFSDKISVGSQLKELLPGVEYPANDKIAETFVTRQASTCVYAYNIGNKVFFIEHRFLPIMSKGDVAYVLVLHHDQTNAHLQEMKIMQNEMILNTTIENAVIGITNIDSEGSFSFVNSSMERLTGYSKKELLGTKFYDKIHYQERDQFIRLLKKTIVGKAYNYTTTKRYQKKNGSLIWVEICISAIYDNEKKFINGICIFFDITKRIRYEEKLKQNEEAQRNLNATKDKFFSIIAHDLKNPFATISLLAKTSARENSAEDGQPSSTENTMNLIKEASDGGYSLLSNLLTWAKNQTGHTRCIVEPFNIAEVASIVLNSILPTAKVKSVELINRVPTDINILADKNMFRTIFRNLLSNAIKFTHSGGQVICRANRSGNFAEIQVADNGVGIPKENAKKIFSIEGSISTKGTNNENGTGLGLIICQEFVTKNGGKIWVDSKVGEGSTFTFTLPIAQ